MPGSIRPILIASSVVLSAAMLLSGAERTVDPTFLHRYLPGIAERMAGLSTGSCHYKPVFGAGDSETRIVKSVARFGEVTIDAGGTCALVNYPREEQVYVVTEGAPAVHYDGSKRPVKKLDYLYLPPTVSHGLSNPGSAPAKVLVMGWKIPVGRKLTIPDGLRMANIQDVPLRTVGHHPKSSRFRLLMGTTESKRDRLAVAHVMTSLFVMEFEPGGTNFPHHHRSEEEFYLLLEGKGDIVAGGGRDGIVGRHPSKSGDAYFFRLNCTVGFYASSDPSVPRARILAARSTFPR